MLEHFHSVGKWPVERERLNSLQRDVEMEKAVFFNMWEDIPSGPVDILVLRAWSILSASSTIHSIFDSSGWLEERVGKLEGSSLQVEMEKQLAKKELRRLKYTAFVVWVWVWHSLLKVSCQCSLLMICFPTGSCSLILFCLYFHIPSLDLFILQYCSTPTVLSANLLRGCLIDLSVTTVLTQLIKLFR